MNKKIKFSGYIIILAFTLLSININGSSKYENKYPNNNELIKISDVNYNFQKVYVCLGKYAKRYHLYLYCDGLDNCKGEIVSMSKSEAESIGRTLCSRCRKIRDNKR